MFNITLTAHNVRTRENVTFDGLTPKDAVRKWNNLAGEGCYTVERLQIDSKPAPADYRFLCLLAREVEGK